MIANSKIMLIKESNSIHTTCPFCTGLIPVTFEPNYNDNEVVVKGRCKKCHSYISVRTSRNNVVCSW